MLKLLKNCDVYAPKHVGMRDILLAGDKIMKVAEKIEGYEGLDGVEVWHPRHTEEQAQKYAAYAEAHGLLMTGATGTNVNDLTVLLIRR